MDRTLRILNVEDSERDSALLTRHMKAAGYDLFLKRIETAEALKAALVGEEWDLILCDYSMPGFSALAALTVLRATNIDVPFIIISGTIGEEIAVEAMLTGANDYIPKGNLTRLLPAIERELREAESRRAKRKAEEALKASEAELRALFAAMTDVIFVLSADGYFRKIAPTDPTFLYKPAEDLIGKRLQDVFTIEQADLFLRHIHQALDQGRMRTLEYSLQIDGAEIWFDGSVSPMSEDSVLWIARDITQRKRAETERSVISEIIQVAAKITDLDEFLKLVHRSLGQIVCAENCVVMLYDSATGMEHFEFWADKYDPPTPPHLAGKGFGNYVRQTGRALLLTEESAQRIIAAGDAEDVGTPAPSWLGVPLRTPQGTIGVLVLQHYEKANAYSQRDLEFVSSVGDQVALAIERKRAEEALAESEERYRDLVENAIDMIYTQDLEGNYTSINKAAERITGYTREETLARNMAQSVAPETRERIGAQMKASIRAGRDATAYELEIVAKDGHRVAVEVNTRVIQENGVPVAVQGIARDITDRRRAEAELREKSALLEAQLNSAIDGVLVVDEAGRQTIRNQRFVDLFNMPKSIASDPDDAKQVQWVTSLMKDPDSFVERVLYLYSNPYEISRDEIDLKDGTILDRYSAPVLGKDGKYYGRIWTFRDITERKIADEALRESESRLRAIIDTEPECVKLLARDGSLLEMNPAGLRMIEADSFAEVANYKVDALVAEQDRQAFRQLTEKVFRGESGVLEFRLTGLKGAQRWLDTHASPLRDAGGEITSLLAITRDVTERKLGEEARLASERKFQDLVTLAPVGIYQSRPDGSFITANAALANILGYDSADELLTTNFADLYFNPEERGELFDKYEGLGVITDIDLQWMRKDGLPIWIQLTGHAIKGSDGATEYLEGFVRDITKQKSVEANLLESDEKFHHLADNINDAFWIRSPDMNTIHYISPAYEKIWGRTLRSGFADPHEWEEFIVPADRQRVKEAYASLMDDAPNIEVEFRILRPDDETRWVRARGFQVRDAQGSLIRLAGIVTDITEKKRAIEALAASEERYRDLVENAIDIIYTLDVDGNYTSVNKACENITGFSREQSLTRNMFDSIAPEYREKGAQILAAHLAGEKMPAYELELIAEDGNRIAIEVNTEPIIEKGVAIGVQGIARDISERKQAEKEIELTMQRLNAAQRLGRIGDWEWHVATGAITWSAEVFEITGRDPALGPPASYEEMRSAYEPASMVVMDERIAAALESGEPQEYELVAVRPDGERVYVQAICERKKDAAGNIVALSGTCQDISARKLANEATRDSEERFSGAFEHAPIGVALLSRDGHWLKVNRALCDLVGYTEAELLKITFQDITYDEDLGNDLHLRNQLLAGEITSLQIEKRYVHKLGHPVPVLLNVSLVRDANGEPRYLIAQIQDMTERKELEEQFRQSQKMEAVGVLAGGIAHDFNNLLTAINGYSDLTLRKMSQDDPLRRNIVEVKEAGNRAAELTSQLLAFSRKQVLRTEVINLNTVVSNIENMLRRIIKESIELRVVLDPMLGNVRADPGQIEQVIMNLAINARDAMPGGGSLTIETQSVFLDDDYVAQHINVTPGDFIKMTVTDTGEGMDAATQARMFEPFFTTKEAGKGTGLGLSTVYGIVKQSGGDILVYSEPGHGTTFKIYLRCVDETVAKPKWVGEKALKYTGTETILLVEDEEIVRNLVREVLADNGYKVLEAAGGDAALAICATYSDPIHLLLTDVIMPKMGGSELRDNVVKLLPDIRVLFMSGYTDDSVAHRGVFDSDAAFMEKPFTPDALARKVREVLES